MPPEELPRGWSAFCSRLGAGERLTPHWYATAPWFVDKLKAHARYTDSLGVRDAVNRLYSTVDAGSWELLKATVEEQNRLYDQVVALWREEAATGP